MEHECPRSTLDRRRLITLAGAAFFASSLARAGSELGQRLPATAPESPLARLVRWASDAGIPLVLLLEGTVAEYRWLQWKTVFEQASLDALADLGLCEFEFSTARDVFRVWPDAALNPVMIPLGLVIEPGSSTFKEIRIAAELPDAAVFRDPLRANELAPWLRDVYGTFHRVIAPDKATFDRRMRVALGLAPEPATRDRGLRSSPGVEIVLAEERRKQLVERARRLRADLFKPRPHGPGAPSTGSSGPCGSSIVSLRSGRFLDCYARC